jgi:hypothetical protein
MEGATMSSASLQQRPAAISVNSLSAPDGNTAAAQLQSPPPLPELLADSVSKVVLKEQRHSGHHQHHRGEIVAEPSLGP